LTFWRFTNRIIVIIIDVPWQEHPGSRLGCVNLNTSLFHHFSRGVQLESDYWRLRLYDCSLEVSA